MIPDHQSSSTSADPDTAPRITVGVVGAAGYTGLELLRVLTGHDGVRIAYGTSRSMEGQPSPVAGLSFRDPAKVEVGDVDVVFLCVPHGQAVEWVEKLDGGPRIIDLTADHRPGSGRESGAVYGLAEHNGEKVKDAHVVANPGCYPTAALCALLPLFDANLVDPDRLTVVNASSGVTGAGRTPRTDLLFAEVAGNYKAYGEGNRHRHLKEIRATLPDMSILFQPHLLPVPRGILETIVVPVREGVDAGRVRGTFENAYSGSRVVEVLDEGFPDLARVVGTDRLSLGVSDVDLVDPPVVEVVSALDNLGKGAAGQAVQNMNLMFGWNIDRGVRC